MHKALSAAEACRALNSSIQVETHLEGFTPANAGGAALAAGCVGVGGECMPKTWHV
jgi:molybdopterin/thiamine biosynthesis adenylyltransferase